jgi:hypothetical protein
MQLSRCHQSTAATHTSQFSFSISLNSLLSPVLTSSSLCTNHRRYSTAKKARKKKGFESQSQPVPSQF